ncbi:hypothetical protein DB346_23325 [Verrucomicrobia bacterium LW23]|nr:hypothetical protein DB346_23325 [Verrucomicrobia bacterium LW23]
MSPLNLTLLCVSLFLVALLYSSAGQAGASGFIAAMALFGLAPDSLKSTALILNILVSMIVVVRFYQAGYISWSLLWPFALASIPAAALGGAITLPVRAFNLLLGVLLLTAALPFFVRRPADEGTVAPPQFTSALASGGTIGLLSGLTGMGGGVLITPLMLFWRWASTKSAAGMSAAFILLNSLATLAGHLATTRHLPAYLPFLALAAVSGGAVGSQLGAAYLPAWAIQRILGFILLIAGFKLILF